MQYAKITRSDGVVDCIGLVQNSVIMPRTFVGAGETARDMDREPGTRTDS